MKIEIIPFDPEYTKNFKVLNIAWLQEYFYVEALDEQILRDPEKHIINPGGHIFFAKINNEIIETVALIKLSEGIFELSKMAISPEYQGNKIGQKLLKFSIEFAKNQGGERLSFIPTGNWKMPCTYTENSGLRKLK